MRAKKLLSFVVLALLFASVAQAGLFGRWAARGIVVNKTFRPTSHAHSLGADGIYRLELRGEDKKVRRQMVTREVFLAYEIGDEFDEQGNPAAAKEARVAAAAKVFEPASKTPSLADVMASTAETQTRLASANLPREMRPETEGF